MKKLINERDKKKITDEINDNLMRFYNILRHFRDEIRKDVKEPAPLLDDILSGYNEVFKINSVVSDNYFYIIKHLEIKPELVAAFIIGTYFFHKDSTPLFEELKSINNKLNKRLNKDGREWRDRILYPKARDILKQKPGLKRAEALRQAFNNLSEEEKSKYIDDFKIYSSSIQICFGNFLKGGKLE